VIDPSDSKGSAILNKHTLMRIAQILYQKETSMRHVRPNKARTCPDVWPNTLRNCHSSRYSPCHRKGFGPGHSSLDTEGVGVAIIWAGGWAMGGSVRRRRCVRTSQNCVKIHGTHYKPQEGPSEEPEVQGHLRRVRGVLTVHPGGSETHLIKEVTSSF
jgi:hypothetical protein